MQIPEGFKRVLIAANVPADVERNDLALDMAIYFGPDDTADPTVWEWTDFFDDVCDGLVSRDEDGTMRK